MEDHLQSLARAGGSQSLSDTSETTGRRLQAAIIGGTRRALLGGLLRACASAVAQPSAPENNIKAAFLAKLSQYLEWPAAVFTSPEQPIIIGILGDDPFGPEFDASLRAFKVAGRSLMVRRLRRVEDAGGCQLLHISRSEDMRLKPILATLQGKPIFTTGDHDDFLKLGGTLRFWRKGESVAFHISHDALRESRITAHPRLLQLSNNPAKPQ
ncbi:MAG: YfiR family protein [Verrucomicrobia bacterium]|nr:YfiR family protein [Verrucomicrobiota bacterium]